MDRQGASTTTAVLQHLQAHQSDSLDILEVAFLKAAVESASYYEVRMRSVPAFSNNLDLLSHAIRSAKLNGLYLEFGVATGTTINHIATQTENDKTVFGFDSFAGLPETWRTGFRKGAFSQCTLPAVANQVTLVQGVFDETLPAFLEMYQDQVAFMHVDCDLYTSTKSLFKHLTDRISEGTVIVFDEYFNFPGWQQDEYKAFQEFVADRHLSYDYIGFVSNHQQVAVCIRNGKDTS